MNNPFQTLHLPQDNAFQACSRCHKQKRKCDRRLPQCSLCIHLGRKCHYPLKTCDTALSSPDRLQLPIDVFSPYGLSVNIPVFVRSILESPLLPGREIPVFTDRYFKTVHPWFPVLAWERFIRLLPSFWTGNNDTGCLLVLAVYLLTQQPSRSAHASEVMRVYEFIKGMLGFLEGKGTSSDAYGLQCRILIALFEIGHGLGQQAYVSIAGAVRIGYERFMRLGLDQEGEETEERICIDEPRMSWWAVVILDRYIALQQNTPPASASLPPSALRPRYLPSSSSGSNSHLSFPEHDDSYSLDPPHPLHAFMHLFHASHLLAQVLTHTRHPTPEFTFNMEEAIRIVVAVEAFSNLISKSNPDMPKSCDDDGDGDPSKLISEKERAMQILSPVHALLNSTFLLLYTFGFIESSHLSRSVSLPTPADKERTIHCSAQAIASLREKVGGILEGCRAFIGERQAHGGIGDDDDGREEEVVMTAAGMSPFAIHAVYTAAVSYRDVCERDPAAEEGKWNEDRNAFRDTLGIIGSRWGAGLSEKKKLDAFFESSHPSVRE